MRLFTGQKALYPKFAYYLKVNLPEILFVPSIVNAINRIGQINRARLHSAVKWGTDPVVRVTNIGRKYGQFTPGIGSNEIRINTKLVNDFENGLGKVAGVNGTLYIVGVTVLHEMIHWGDDKDGIDRPGEEGEEFERTVYGHVIF